MVEGAAPAGSLPVFDTQNPQSFYLAGSQAELEALSDVVLVADGVRLPVHSQVLSLQSGVLRGLFADFLGASSSPSGVRVGCKRKADDKEDPLVLEEPLRGCSLYEAALFLRLCYRPQDVSPANLEAERRSLSSLLRLAHKLDVQHILKAVGKHMAESEAASTDEVITWLEVAEECQQTELHLGCIARLAQRLVVGSPEIGSLSGCIAGAAQLKRCDKGTLLLLLGLTVQAQRQLAPRNQLMMYQAPSAGDIAKAIQNAANPGMLEWRIERFSQQPAEVGSVLRSPTFMAAGRQCQLSLYPNGMHQAAEGHVSLLVAIISGHVRAEVTLTVCDQANKNPEHISSRFIATLGSGNKGYSKFASRNKLPTRPGYLAGDTLVIRAKVCVLL